MIDKIGPSSTIFWLNVDSPGYVSKLPIAYVETPDGDFLALCHQCWPLCRRGAI
jgi:hypothetical protein